MTGKRLESSGVQDKMDYYNYNNPYSQKLNDSVNFHGNVIGGILLEQNRKNNSEEELTPYNPVRRKHKHSTQRGGSINNKQGWNHNK